MTRFLNFILCALVLGILLQALVVVNGSTPSNLLAPPPPPVQVGDTLGVLTGHDERGVRTTVQLSAVPGAVTILYVFHPECAHCDRIAPEWAAHLTTSKRDAGVRSIAVTRASHAVASEYATHFGWQSELLSLESLDPSHRARSLVSRTPWLFVFDSSGVLRHHGHGSDLNGLERALASIPTT